MHLRFYLVTAFLLLLPMAGHADTIRTFQLSSDLTGGYIAQGTITVDTTTGRVEPSNISLSQGGVVDATFTDPDLQEVYNGDLLTQFLGSSSGFTYELLLPGQSLVGYAGGAVCTESVPCNGLPSGAFLPGGLAEGATDGKLTAVTPEPASFILLATGMVGIAVAGWRRRTRRLSES